MLLIDAMEAGGPPGTMYLYEESDFMMKKIKYQWWIFFLSLIITLAPCQQLYATIKQFADEKGTIHINNITNDQNKLMNEDYNASGQHKNSAVANLHEPTPSNIFPEPEEANALSSIPVVQAPAPEP